MPSNCLTTTGWANGGEAVARDDSGRAVFVADALPGETVEVAFTSERKRFARATTLAVRDASPDRVIPTCRHVESGCGGCDLAHVSAAGQREYAATAVFDALERIARLPAPAIELDPPLPQLGQRTTVRCLITGGRAGFRKRSSHDPLTVDSCEMAHPLIQELITDGRYGEADEVTIRAATASGERLVIVEPTAVGVLVPSDTVVIGADELAAGRRAWIHEEVAGRTWRISARSFFQSRPDGAARLVELARSAVDGAPGGPLVDLYSGVGLLVGSVSEDRSLLAVESSRSAVADARHNLTDLGVTIVRCDVEKWKPSAASVVIADPPRSGLRKAGVARIAETQAPRVIVISCDAGSLGRDAGLLSESGYSHQLSTVVNMFPQTSHVEVISVFDR